MSVDASTAGAAELPTRSRARGSSRRARGHSAEVSEDLLRIDLRYCAGESASCRFDQLAYETFRCDNSHQTVHANRLSCNQGITLVSNRLPFNKGESAERCNRLVETITRELRRKRLTQLLPRLRKQKQGIGSGASIAA